PAAQARAERHRLELLERDETLATIARRLAEHRAAVDTLSDRLRDRRRRETEAARLSAEQLDVLRSERRGLETELTAARERIGRVDVEEAEARLRLDTTIEALRTEFDVEPRVALDAPAPTVPEGTTLAGRARELERDLRVMGPIN